MNDYVLFHPLRGDVEGVDHVECLKVEGLVKLRGQLGWESPVSKVQGGVKEMMG